MKLDGITKGVTRKKEDKPKERDVGHTRFTGQRAEKEPITKTEKEKVIK